MSPLSLLFHGKQLHAKSNSLRAAGATAFGEVLKTNKTLTMVDLSGNEIGGGVWDNANHVTPEGPAALADGLKANSTVQQLDASKNAMGTAGAKAFGDTLRVNKTIQTLDVSDNSFGKMQVGDKVKIKSSGKMKEVTKVHSDGNIQVEGGSGYVNPSEFEWESQVPAFCAGVAASPSLISVSTTF